MKMTLSSAVFHFLPLLNLLSEHLRAALQGSTTNKEQYMNIFRGTT